MTINYGAKQMRMAIFQLMIYVLGNTTAGICF